MMMDKKKKLDKLRMPEKKKMDLSSLGMDDEDGMTDADLSGQEPNPEMEEEAHESEGTDPTLEKVSDEDLMAELKKRGLMKQLEDEDGEEGHDDLMDSDKQKTDHSDY